MTFADLLAALAESPDHQVTVPASWAQGRAGYGGLIAALVFEGMRAKASGRPVRSLAITFVGPVAPGEPMQVEAEVLREGKAVTQILGRAMQNGQTMCIIQGSFGASRESVVDVAAQAPPQAKAPQDCRELPFVKGISPDFIQHFSVRWLYGDLPFTNSRKREMGGWMSFSQDEGDIHEGHILGLMDVWPPAVLPHLSQRAPASTLTWTIEFMQPQPQVGNTESLLYRAEIERAKDGYGHTAAKAWNERGELVAISRQTVTVFG